MGKFFAAITHWFLTAWLVMLVLGANHLVTWGFWRVLFAEWAVEAVIGGAVASGLMLAASMDGAS